MPLSSTQALVLHSEIFNEQDKRILLLTSSKGIMKAIAPGAARNRNRFGSLLELFTEGDFFYYWNEEKETVTLSKGELIKSFFHVVSQPECLFYFFLMAEIIQNITPFHHKEERLYRMVHSILSARETGTAAPEVLAYFLVWILRIEGLMFQPHACTNCHTRPLSQAWLRNDFRGILCAECRRDEMIRLNRNQLAYIRWTQRHPPSLSFSWEPKESLPQLLRILIRKIEFHSERSLKSTIYLSEFR